MKKSVPMCKIGFIVSAICFCLAFGEFAYCFEHDKKIGMWFFAGIAIQTLCLLLLNGIEIIIKRNNNGRN